MNADVQRGGTAGLATLTLHSLEELPLDVRALFDAAQSRDPQLGAPWFANLARTVFEQTPTGATESVRLHILRNNGQAVAALPLLVVRQGRSNQVRALANYYSSLYAPALAPGVQASDLVHLLRDVLATHRPMACLQMAPMDVQAPAFALMRQAMKLAGLTPFDYFSFGNWYCPVHTSADDYLAARPGEVRNTLRRMGKKFMAADGRFELLTQTAEVARAVQEFNRIYRLSWKQPEPYADFIPGLVQMCAQQGWLRMGLAVVGGQAVAAQLWIVAAGKASIYKLAYDPAFKHLSPGSLLTAYLMRHVIDADGVQEIDYLTGDDAYKNQWMNHRRERRGLIAFNPRTPAGLLGLAREAGARALKPLRAGGRHRAADEQR